MYNLRFDNICEIRMGSPYNLADIKLTGNYIPDFKGKDFQDKGSVNSDKSKVILVQWAIEKNSPGFVIWQINEDKKSVDKSDRIEGCCEDVCFLEGGKIQVKYSKMPKNLQVEVIELVEGF